MNITVSTAESRIVIDAATQTAYLSLADVAWTDGDVKGSMTVERHQDRLTARRVSVEGNAPEFDALDYINDRLGSVLDEARSHLDVPLRVESDGQLTIERLPTRPSAPKNPRSAWRRATPEFLREVAGIYLAALEANEPPARAVMSHYDVKRDTVNGWLRKCRDEGYLPPAR